MAIIRDYKVNVLPTRGVPDSRYYLLKDDNTVEEYVTDKDGRLRKVGNSVPLNVRVNNITQTVNSVVFSNSNNVTFGLSDGTITASVAGGGGADFVLSNSNGISFGTNGSTVTASYTVPTNYISSNQSTLFQLSGNYLTTAMVSDASVSFVNTSQSSLFQQTSLMSNYLDTGYTSHTHGEYLDTSQSSLFEHSSHTTIFLTSQSLQTDGHYTISASASSASSGVLVFSNSNGFSFGFSNGIITGSYTNPTDYVSTNQSSLFQQTSQMSNYLDSNYTTHTHGEYLGTDYTSHTHSEYLGTNYTSHTHSQYVNSSETSAYQLIANSSDSLGTTYTTHTHSQYLNTSQSSLFRHTSADSQLQFTSQMSDYLQTGYTTHTHSQYLNTSQSSLFEQSSHTTLFLTSQSAQAFSAGAASSTFQTLSFQDSNGVSFSNNAGAIRITHGLQQTSATSAITSAALHTSASRVMNIVANTNSTAGGTASLSSNVSFSAANGITFYTSAGGAIVANFNSANYQQTSNTSLITSNALNTSQSSLFQHTSATSNITSNALNTSQSSLFRHTSQNSQLQFTSQMSDYLGTGYTTHTHTQSVQTQSRFNLTLSGNSTSGGAGYQLISSGVLTLAGGNNITISQDGNALTISGPNVGGAQTGISGVLLSNTTYTSGTISFRDGNGMSWASTTGQGISLTHDLQYTSNTSAITSNALNTSQSSLFRHTSANSQLQFTSQMSDYQTTGAYLTTAAQSTQTLMLSISGNVATTNSSRVSAGGYVLAGGNGVTIQQSNNSLSLSVATNYQSQGAYLTTAMASNASTAFAGIGATTAGGAGFSVTHNTAGLSVSIPSWLTTARASNDAIGLNTAQSNVTWTVNSSGLSLDNRGYAGTGTSATNASVTLNSNGLAISVGAGGGGATVNGSTGNVSLTVASSLSFSSNGSTISFGLASNLSTAFQTTGNYLTSQSNQAWSGSNASSAFQTLSFANSNGISWSNNGGSVVITHGLQQTSATSAITANALHSSASRVINLIAATNSTGGGAASLSSNISFSNANGISFYTSAGNAIVGSYNSTQFQSTGNYLTTAMSSNASSAFAGTGFTSAGANISMSGTLNTAGLSLSASVAAPGAAAENNNHNLLGANTAGNTTASGSTIGLSGINLTLSGTNASQIVISAPGTSSLSGTGGISISVNGSTISIGNIPSPARSYIEVMQGERLTTIRNLSETVFSRRPIFMPFWLDGTGMQASTIRFMVSGAGSSNRSLRATFHAGLYSAVNSTQLSLFGSTSQGFDITAGTQSTVWNGPRLMDFTGITGSMTNEGRWVLALYVSANGHDATNCNVPIYGADNVPALSGFFVGGTTSATNNTSHVFPYWGVYSATSAGFPNSVGITQINGGNSASLLDAYAIIKQI